VAPPRSFSSSYWMERESTPSQARKAVHRRSRQDFHSSLTRHRGLHSQSSGRMFRFDGPLRPITGGTAPRFRPQTRSLAGPRFSIPPGARRAASVKGNGRDVDGWGVPISLLIVRLFRSEPSSGLWPATFLGAAKIRNQRIHPQPLFPSRRVIRRMKGRMIGGDQLAARGRHHVVASAIGLQRPPSGPGEGRPAPSLPRATVTSGRMIDLSAFSHQAARGRPPRLRSGACAGGALPRQFPNLKCFTALVT